MTNILNHNTSVYKSETVHNGKYKLLGPGIYGTVWKRCTGVPCTPLRTNVSYGTFLLKVKQKYCS